MILYRTLVILVSSTKHNLSGEHGVRKDRSEFGLFLQDCRRAREVGLGREEIY